MISVSMTDVYAAWNAYAAALRRGGANSAQAREARARYKRLADLHDQLAGAHYEAQDS